MSPIHFIGQRRVWLECTRRFEVVETMRDVVKQLFEMRTCCKLSFLALSKQSTVTIIVVK